MKKVISGLSNLDLETKLNELPAGSRVIALSGLVTICEVLDSQPSSNPEIKNEIYRQYPDKSFSIISEVFDKNGILKSREEKEFDSNGEIKA